MTIESAKQAEPAGGRRITTQVTYLDELVGAHPDALKQIYRSGKPADPAELGDAPRGRILALEPMSRVYMATRPLVAALASDWMPWRGKEFDHGGNSGMNLLFGRKLIRFKAEVVPSEIDGAPTLALTYGEKAYRNPWPLAAVKDELRAVGSGFAIGPMFVPLRGTRRLVLWFGLERVQAG